MEQKTCPCRKTAQSPLPYESCCQPYIEGRAQAPTAEALMRSRYSAFAVGNIDYLVETVAPEQRHDIDRGSLLAWSKESSWDGLEIVETIDGQAGDTTGIVEFIAHFTRARMHEAHHERSTFRHENGRWYFVEGAKPKGKPIVKDQNIGRNDPCPCGSGKKYKKCCGA